MDSFIYSFCDCCSVRLLVGLFVFLLFFTCGFVFLCSYIFIILKCMNIGARVCMFVCMFKYIVCIYIDLCVLVCM